ncbi:MAG: nitroreductase family protein [Propionibacteriaceae bacterium]
MTNPTLELLLQRRSIRSFTDESVKGEDLAQIIAATQQAPSSINGQQISLVVVTDPERVERLAQLAGGQPQVAAAPVFVVFVIDYHRTTVAAAQHGVELAIHRDQEGVLTGALDAGIALATFQTAAHALGYGTTAIGGIRQHATEVAQLLGLPQRTFPIVGSTLGVINSERLPQVKPRVPVESFAMDNSYDAQAVAAGVEVYDRSLRQWCDAQGLTTMNSYSQEIARFYGTVSKGATAAALAQQELG